MVFKYFVYFSDLRTIYSYFITIILIRIKLIDEHIDEEEKLNQANKVRKTLK